MLLLASVPKTRHTLGVKWHMMHLLQLSGFVTLSSMERLEKQYRGLDITSEAFRRNCSKVVKGVEYSSLAVEVEHPWPLAKTRVGRSDARSSIRAMEGQAVESSKISHTLHEGEEREVTEEAEVLEDLETSELARSSMPQVCSHMPP